MSTYKRQRRVTEEIDVAVSTPISVIAVENDTWVPQWHCSAKVARQGNEVGFLLTLTLDTFEDVSMDSGAVLIRTKTISKFYPEVAGHNKPPSWHKLILRMQQVKFSFSTYAYSRRVATQTKALLALRAADDVALAPLKQRFERVNFLFQEEREHAGIAEDADETLLRTVGGYNPWSTAKGELAAAERVYNDKCTPAA